MSALSIAKRHAAGSEDPFLFMYGFSSGRKVAEEGGDGYQEFRRITSDAVLAGFLEGLASVRSRTAKPSDYVPYSADRAKAVAW
ncbi:hypothetical protein AB0M57_04310 [Streptomyces sp. NPDC051597]|uniref:hypothetical protein n=1 Tax=Streptomyces sp. NPDC051597 TaxID=3155049 RepID=UPI003426F1BC